MYNSILTKKALYIAEKAHEGQLDKAGRPYVLHPYAVAEKMNDEQSTCVALLHDVVEDTNVTLDDLRKEGFSDEIVEAVDVLTHRKGVPYMDYIRKVKKNEMATKVKLADLEHNSDLSRLKVVTEKDVARQEKYKKATKILNGYEEEHSDELCR